MHWRFAKEAKSYINDQVLGKEPVFNKIAFENIYPLFGQIDIKGSSVARNLATQQDLTLQLNKLKSVFNRALEMEDLPIYEQFIFQINIYLKDLKENFQVDSEQQITRFF